jgi:hypothetical protein
MTSLPDAGELLQQLERDHRADRHLYRGQLRRHAPHRWKAQGEEREVEALYPADYRFHYEHRDLSPESSEAILGKVTAARAYGRTVRDQFVLFLIGRLASMGQAADWFVPAFRELQAAVAEHRPPHDTAFYRVAWSLAQHYLVATALTDLTVSPRVAGWFATNPWDAAAPGPAAGERGVIYRVDRVPLQDILLRGTALMRAWQEREGHVAAPELFLVDIRDIPPELARRPAAQQGASLYGFDQSHVLAAAVEGGAVEAFEFSHRPDVRAGPAREDVIPPDDPFLRHLELFQMAREALRPKSASPSAEATGRPDLLERANTVLRLGLRSARESRRVQLTDRYAATVFDQIDRLGDIRFQHLLIVEDKKDGTVVCAVSAEPMAVPDALRSVPQAALEKVGFGGDALGFWTSAGRRTLDVGTWSSADAFTERALEAARQAIRGEAS